MMKGLNMKKIKMNKLNELIGLCKCGVYVSINAHRDYYESVEQHFNSNPIKEGDLEDIPSDVYEKMKELNIIIEIQFYPDTPIGFYNVFHYNLDMALDLALETFKNK